MLREIVIDTETTGLDPANGDRLIELGCIEIVNRIPTGREFHRYLNPERDIHRDAVAVHGLTGEFLKDKPLFKDVADEFLELHRRCPARRPQRHLRPRLPQCRARARRRGRRCTFDRVVDTLVLARRRHPAGPNSLDALCKRYGIDTLRSAPSTARCSTRCCSPTSTSSCWASGRPRLGLGGQRRRRPSSRSCASPPPSRARNLCARGSAEARAGAPRVRQDAGRQGALAASSWADAASDGFRRPSSGLPQFTARL